VRGGLLIRPLGCYQCSRIECCQEPSATQLFLNALAVSQGTDHKKLDKAEFVSGLEHMLKGLDGVPNSPELRQLNRQGVGRFMGALSTCRLFGLIESIDPEVAAAPQDEEQEPQEILTLGLQKGLYRCTGDTSQVVALVEHTPRAFCKELAPVETPCDLQALAGIIKWALLELGGQVSSLRTKSGGRYGRHVYSMAWRRAHPPVGHAFGSDQSDALATSQGRD